MKLLLTTIAASVLLSGVAYAEQQTTYSKTTTSDGPITETGPQPYDFGRLNESPIRGRGQIHVNHNMPAPNDTDRKLTEAKWLLQDDGWTCYKPNTKLSRR